MEPQVSPIQRKPPVKYEPTGQFITEADKLLLREHFKDNIALLKVIKKVLFPSYADEDHPLEFTDDAFTRSIKWETVATEEAKSIMLARQLAIEWFGGGLAQLYSIAQQSDETAEELEVKRAKDSAK